MAEKNYVGKLLDSRYRVIARAGSGGSARVYRAQDVLMHRIVALKILGEDETEFRLNTRSFETEVKAVSMLSHRNIVSVYDVSVQGNVKYIVMEFVDGITLREYMSFNGALPAAEVIACSRQVLYALRAAHTKGIIHRDIKPQNIMLLRTGQIKVADFGIARLPDRDNFQMSDRAVGTVQYISPEQATTNCVDERSDLYSLGVVMYEMATGVRPFDAADANTVAMMQVSDEPMPPRSHRDDIPPALEQIILRAMRKEPSARYENADAMLRALERAEHDPGGTEPEETPSAVSNTKSGGRGLLARLFGQHKKQEIWIDGNAGERESITETRGEQEDQSVKVILDREKYDRKHGHFQHTAKATDEFTAEETVSDEAITDENTPIDVTTSEITSVKAETEQIATVVDVVADESEPEISAEEESEPEVSAEDESEPEEVRTEDSMPTATVIFQRQEATAACPREPLSGSDEGETDITVEDTVIADTVVAGRSPEVAQAAQPVQGHSSGMRRATWILGICTGILSLALAVLVWYSGLFYGTRVPHVSVYEGEASVGGIPVAVDYVEDNTPAGTVLSQSPCAGYTREAPVLYLQVSTGRSPYTNAEYKDILDERLLDKLTTVIANIRTINQSNPDYPMYAVIIYEPSMTVPNGNVVKYTLTTADVAHPGETTVILTVSTGAGN